MIAAGRQPADVGSIFGLDEGDIDVRAVEISDTTNPEMTDSQAVLDRNA